MIIIIRLAFLLCCGAVGWSMQMQSFLGYQLNFGPWISAFLGVAIGLLASFANLLNHHHYPVFTAEVGLVAAVLLIVALLLTGLHRLAQPRLAFLITALVSAIIIDLGTDMPNTVFR